MANKKIATLIDEASLFKGVLLSGELRASVW